MTDATKRTFKVLVNYHSNGVAITQSLYSGPHKKHAEKAYASANILGRHGVLIDCTITFFDGFRLRKDYEKAY